MRVKSEHNIFLKPALWAILLQFLIVGCGADQLGSKIDIKSIFNPDEIPPEIAVLSMQSDMERLNDYSITYQLRDDVKGSGISTGRVLYSPDPDNVDFYSIGALKEGVHDLKICAPNSNSHPNPTFKFRAIDRNDNRMEDYELALTEEATSLPTLQNMSINELLPEVSLTPFPKTADNTVDIAIDACQRRNCSNNSYELEDLQNQTFINLKLNDATQPAVADAGWVSCEDVLTNGLTSPTFPSDGDHVLSVWVKSVDSDYVDVSSISQDVTINYDTTPPALAGRVVEGPTLIAKSQASYRLDNCSDVESVFINYNGDAEPSASDPGWQSCSQEFYTMSYSNFVEGDNTLNFWLKDDIENVNSTPLTYTTNYNPPTFSVVDGPTITSPVADITISFCQEADIEYVLFNSDGSAPDADSSEWQTCSKAEGHLKSYELAPGPHVLKAFLKYEDGLVSPNPLDVDVTYSPLLTWLDAPSVNRPQTSFSVASCEGVDSVWIQKSSEAAPDPASTSTNWQACDTNSSLSYDELEVGDNSLSGWLKDSEGNLYPDAVDTTATFNPPTASVVDGPDISTTDSKASLTISECDGVSEVLVELTNTEPASGDPEWVNCSTAFGAIKSPTLSEGSHSLYTWIKYDDGLILPFADQDDITFTPPDTTPPPTAGLTLTLENGDTGTPPTLENDSSRAFFTLNSCNESEPEEDVIEQVFLSIDDSTQPSSSTPGWIDCSTATSGLATVSMVDGDHDVAFFFKDLAGNVTAYDGTGFQQTVRVNTSASTDPPPRPPIEIQNAPTLTTSPAKMRIDPGYDCTGIDQVLFEIDEGAETEPLASSTLWQDCADATYDMTYQMILAGEYNLRAWFKSPAGIINSTPRRVSFIFDPSPSALADPVAYWSLDQEHIYKQKAVDIVGQSHLTLSSQTHVTAKSDAAVKQGLELDGTKSYLVGRNHSQLKPTVGVTLSLWAYLTNGEMGSKALAGNISESKGYGLELQAGELRFSVNGNTDVFENTSDITTGWHHIVGTSNGQLTELYIDGEKVAEHDTGNPVNISYGCSDLFAIGAKVDCTENVVDGTFFDNAIDEVVVWDTKLSSDDVFQHFVDTSNDFKVNQNTSASSNVTSASFYREITDSSLFTVPDCSAIQFIYSDTTTHPPSLTSPRWQPCAEFTGAFHREDLPIGPHELKIWTKDGYGNLSSNYYFLDTTIEVDTGAPNPILMYNFDNTHVDGALIYDLFSLQHAHNIGASSVTSIENEGLRFTSNESDYVEAKDAAYAQVTDELSISAWANILPGETNAQVIAGNRTGSGHGYSLEIESGGTLSFIVETDQGQRKTSLALTSINSGYSNIIGTYDGDNIRIYINGSLESSQNYAGVIGAITYDCLSSFVVGARATCNQGGVAPFYDNIIDEVAVWDQALDSTQAFNFYSGQDNIPPDPVAVTPRNDEYTVGIPVAKLNVSDCSDTSSVYVALDDSVPPADASNWQTCSETGDLIETPLLSDGENIVKVWFKDAAENVSESAFTLDPNITFTFDFTIPEPGSYWSFNRVNIDGSTVYDLINDHHGTSTSVTEVEGASYEGLSFNGTTSRITAPHTSAHQPTEAISLSAWVKSGSFPADERTLAGNAYGNGGYALTLDQNEIVWKVYVNGMFQTIRADVSGWDTNEYHLIVGTYGQGVLRLFIDNVEQPIVDLGDSTLEVQYEHANAFKIAAQVDDGVGNVPGSFFQGELDEVSMWPAALTDTVVDEIYSRGQSNDQIYYNVTPPDMPTTLSIDYYNSLVSRANLTVTDCTGIDYIIITDSEFPPDKNDEDWQLCNTLVGGTLSKELSTSEEFGKVWTKDFSGNISKEFEYTPLTTKYDLPIARPIVHWTFDNAHYNSSEKYFFDRISGAKLLNTYTKRTFNMTAEDAVHCPVPEGEDPTEYRVIYNLDYSDTDSGTLDNQSAILLQGAKIDQSRQFMRTDDMGKLRPKEAFSISAWVEINPGETAQKHIISTWENSGYAIRLRNVSGRNRVEFVVKLENGETLSPYLETSEITNDPDTGSKWHLVTGVYDGQKASFYFDGIFVKSFEATTPSPISYNDSVSLMVGADPAPGKYPNGFPQCSKVKESFNTPTLADYTGGYNNGKIDEILMWDKPLTGLMVSSLYHNGADIIYEGDTTPPTPPEVAQENQRSLMYSKDVYASVLSCNDVSGVLVNEGTQPEKQDARWEVCRIREGSFKYENLTPGGHTVTLWFKDAAGNVTPTSSDVVVDYVSLDTPKANAYWPLDDTHYIDRQQRDIVSDSKEHELHATHFDNELNPTATPFPAARNASKKAVDLSNNAYLAAASTRLLRPVNELSVGGWFYLTQGDTATKRLIDHYDETSGNPSGYQMDLYNGNLRFITTLFIHPNSTLSVPTSSYTTGWHHVMGVFDGENTYLYLDGVQVDSEGPLSEEDFVVWSDTTPMLIGASSNDEVLPGNYFNDKVSDIGVWGMTLSASDVADIYQKGVDGELLTDPKPAPNNVSNAYAYYYDTFGPRARITILNCTNTPYIRVTDDNVAPSNTGKDWHDCRTDPGAIFSEELTPGTNEVYVWAKNANGDVSSTSAVLELDNPVVDDRSLPLPYSYLSFNTDQNDSSSGYPKDMLLGQTGVLSGSSNVSFLSFLDQQAASLTSSTADYVRLAPYYKNDLREGITVMLWADLTTGETGERGLFSTRSTSYSNRPDLSLYTKGGKVYFEVYRTREDNYEINSNFSFASFPTSQLKTGPNFLTATYDGRKIQLYLDGVLRDEVDIPTEYFQADVERRIQLDRLHNFDVGLANVANSPGELSSGTSRSANTEIDEFMVFDDILDEADIWNHYKRLKEYVDNDTNSLGNTPNIAVDEMTNTGVGTWDSDRKSPYYTLDSCEGMTSVYISLSNTTPLYDTQGWQACLEDDGTLTGPDLLAGTNTVYFWFKDRHGNISSPQTIDVDYNVPPTPDPVAYWPFDTATIFNGRAYEFVSQKHADIYYADEASATRLEGLYFNEATSFVRVPHAESYKTEEFTISGWFKIDNGGPNILASTSQSSSDGWRLRTYNTNSLTTNPDLKSYLELRVATTSGTRTSTIPFYKFYGPGNMRHLAVTYDGRRVRWYVDASLVHTDDFGSNARAQYSPSQTPLFIGGDYSTTFASTSLLEGTIDEFAIHDRALVPDHITDVYNTTNSGDPIYEAPRTNIASGDIAAEVIEVYQGTDLFLGNRIRLTMNSCTGMDMIHVSDPTLVTAPPADNDPDWQTCNTFDGGILSAPFDTGTGVNPQVYVRTFEGLTASTAGTLTQSVDIGANLITVPRSKAHFSLNSSEEGYRSGLLPATELTPGEELYDSHNWVTEGPFGVFPASGQCGLPAYESSIIHEAGFNFNRTEEDCLIFPAQPANQPDDDISISAWVELTRGDTQNKYIVSNRQNGTNESSAGSGLRLKDGRLEFFVRIRTRDSVSGPSFEETIGYDTQLYGDGMHHVTGTYDGTRMTLYLDGVRVATKRLQVYGGSRYHIINDTVSPWMIGAEISSLESPLANSFFNGKIDDIRIWDQTLSENEVFALYRYGSQFIPGNDSDGIAPEQTGIALSEESTLLSKPFANIQMPGCTSSNVDGSSNAIPINAVYIRVTDSATTPADPPDQYSGRDLDGDNSADGTGWLYCTLDPDKLRSLVLQDGPSYIWVYLRDEEGDVGLADTDPIEVEYTPPQMIAAKSYFDFETSSSSQADLINGVVLRTSSNGTRTSPSIQSRSYLRCDDIDDQPYCSSSTSFINNRSTSLDFELEKDFAVSFWHYPRQMDEGDTHDLLEIPDQLHITRDSTNEIRVNVSGAPPRYAQSPLFLEEWNHILVTRTGTKLSLYLNGVLDTSIEMADNNLALSNNWFQMAQALGNYDELAIYDQGLTEDQALYLYFLGSNDETIAQRPDQTVPGKIPDYYYRFDSADVFTGSTPNKLPEALGTGLDFDIINNVDTANATAKVGESFYFTRYVPEAPETNDDNVSGVPEYLEANAPLELGGEFTISVWVNPTKTESARYEYYTILDQWMEGAIDEAEHSFILRMHRRDNSTSSTIDRYQFIYKIGTGSGKKTGTVSTSTEDFPTPGEWHHIVVTKRRGQIAMYVNGIQRGFENVDSSQGPNYVPGTTPNLRIGTNWKADNTDGNPRRRFEGHIDELGIWANKGLDFRQVRDLYLRATDPDPANNYPLPYVPEVVLASVDNTTDEQEAPLSISDCGGSDYVRAVVDGAPADYGSWQDCATALQNGLLTPALTSGDNTVYVEFSDDQSTINHTTSDLVVTYNPPVVDPPAAPPVVSLVESSDINYPESTLTTTSSHAEVWIESDSTFVAYYIAPSGYTPAVNESGWKNFTTKFNYKELVPGLNEIDIWFKDSFNQLSTSARSLSITYNQPDLPIPELYFSFEDLSASPIAVYDVAAANREPKLYLNSGSQSSVQQNKLTENSYRLNNSEYLESASSTPDLSMGTNFTIAAWVNINTPTSDAVSIINEWSGDAAEDRYSFEVDLEGRLCFSFQASGTFEYNSDGYKRVCSFQKLAFSQWQHVAVIRSSSSLDLYLNGDQIQGVTMDGNALQAYNPDIPTQIGSQNRNSSKINVLDGYLDEFGVWDVALSVDELRAHYSLGTQGQSHDLDIYAPQVTPIPLSYWDHEGPYTGATPEILEDRMPAALNLEVSNVTLNNTSSFINNYSSFDGSASYSAPSYDIDLTRDFTMATWVYFEGGPAPILRKWGATDPESEFIFDILGDDKVRILYKTDDAGTYTNVQATSLSSLPVNEWSHIAVSRKNDRLSIYINGVLEVLNDEQDTNNLVTNTTPLYMGSVDNTTNYLYGNLDETAIWNKSMEPWQVYTLYKLALNQSDTISTTLKASVWARSNTVTSATAWLTVSDCPGNNTKVQVTTSATPPAAADLSWGSAPNCSTDMGAIETPTLSAGSNIFYVHFKDDVDNLSTSDSVEVIQN